jgi:membrane-bound metal-dependent hydrolase YbcI (DUF457 family)
MPSNSFLSPLLPAHASLSSFVRSFRFCLLHSFPLILPFTAIVCLASSHRSHVRRHQGFAHSIAFAFLIVVSLSILVASAASLVLFSFLAVFLCSFSDFFCYASLCPLASYFSRYVLSSFWSLGRFGQ